VGGRPPKQTTLYLKKIFCHSERSEESLF